MEKKSKHSKLFYQYLLSYVLILATPLIILSVFIGGCVLDILKQEIHENNMYTLQNAKNIVETQLQHVTSTDHKVYLNNMLDGFRLQNDTIVAIDTKKELETYCQMNPFLVDAAYYQADDEYIVAATSSCPKKEFWNIMYDYENWNYEDFLGELESNSGLFFKEAQRVKVKGVSFQRIVTLVIPLDVHGQKCVILLMNEEFFTNALPQTDTQKGASVIKDETGRVMVSKGMEELIDAAYTDASEVEEDIEIVTINGEKYLRSCVDSKSYHWTYESLVLINSIEEKVTYVRLLLSFICLLTIAVGAIGILYFMKRNYSPLRVLEITSNEILANSENENEMNHVKAVLDYLNQQNQRLKTEAEKRKGVLKEQFVIRWMSGHYEDSRQIREQAEKVGVELRKGRYQSAVLRINGAKMAKMQQVAEVLLNSIPKYVDIFLHVQTETEKIFIVAGYDEGQEADVGQYFFESVEMLKNEVGVKTWLALGNPVCKDVSLKDSYKEALKALEYSIIFDNGVIRYDEIQSWNDNAMLNIEPGRLAGYVRKRDVQGLEDFLNASITEMKNKKIGIRQIYMHCNEFIYALKKTIEDLNRDYFIEEPLWDNIMGVLVYDTVYELMDIIKMIASDIIEHLEEQSGKTIREKFLVYISNNCFSADFSTTIMADEFGMSLPQLSRCFKSVLGRNLSDYVTELKIEKAKELLLYEDKAIKDIAEEVGYSSVNSFNRRFKQVTGYTPGELRSKK